MHGTAHIACFGSLHGTVAARSAGAPMRQVAVGETSVRLGSRKRATFLGPDRRSLGEPPPRAGPSVARSSCHLGLVRRLVVSVGPRPGQAYCSPVQRAMSGRSSEQAVLFANSVAAARLPTPSFVHVPT